MQHTAAQSRELEARARDGKEVAFACRTRRSGSDGYEHRVKLCGQGAACTGMSSGDQLERHDGGTVVAVTGERDRCGSYSSGIEFG